MSSLLIVTFDVPSQLSSAILFINPAGCMLLSVNLVYSDNIFLSEIIYNWLKSSERHQDRRENFTFLLVFHATCGSSTKHASGNKTYHIGEIQTII